MTAGRWEPPRLRIGGEDDEERHATWLELFFDLVFVVAVAELAHKLSDNISPSGFFAFVLLFVGVWWAWVGETFYDTRFDTDDPVHRLLTVLQMFAVVALAINVHDGFGATGTGFALSYVAIRAVLVVQYLRAGRYVPDARPLTDRFARGFALAALLWVMTTLLPSPWRFVLVGVALAVDFGTPIFAGRLHAQLAPSSSHLPERFGLFTIIVLGEAIVAVVQSLASQGWTPSSTVEGLLGLSIAFSLWWIYFDNLDGTAIQAARQTGRTGIYQVWLYAHLPLAIGLTAAGVGVEHALASQTGGVLPAADRWLLCGAVALSLLAIGIIHLATAAAGSPRCRRSQAMSRIVAAAATLALAAVGGRLAPIVLVGILAAIGGSQVALELRGTLRIRAVGQSGSRAEDVRQGEGMGQGAVRPGSIAPHQPLTTDDH